MEGRRELREVREGPVSVAQTISGMPATDYYVMALMRDGRLTANDAECLNSLKPALREWIVGLLQDCVETPYPEAG